MKVIGIPLNPPVHGQYTGVERYVFELVRAMMQLPLPEGVRIEVYSAKPLESFGEFPKGWTNIVLPWKYKGWTHMRLSVHMLRHAPDVLFVPVHEIPFFTGRARVIATIHDIAFAIVPGLYSKKDVKRQRWALHRVLKRAAHVISVSQSTKDDLLRVMGVEPARVTVAQLASTSTLEIPTDEVVNLVLRNRHIPKRQYLLYIGRLEHKKGIIELLKIFDEYKKSQGIGDPLHLVLIGKYGFGEKAIKQTLAVLNRKDIHVLGFVEDQEMAAILAGARAFIFPTRYEGFGIPLLEAMQFNLPILTTDLPITREVAAGAALYAQYGDVGGWLHNIRQVMRNAEVEELLIEAGNSQRENFSWERTARTTLEAITNV